jgi:cytochrome c-type biogenesis protein CcmH/NrfF
MREELSSQVKLGKNRDEIRQFFVEKYGSQEPLGAPLDEGFNRLIWMLPWTVGGGAAAAVGFVALRWSRKDHQAPAGPASAVPDPELDERLDDELRNLD